MTNDTLNTVSKERFLDEFKKLFLKSDKPSVGLQLAWDLGLFEKTFPEFKNMADTLQHPEHHPEGDVWTHTKLAIDALSELLKNSESHLDDDTKLILYLAVLCHDLGKPETTWYDLEDNGYAKAYGHDEAGVIPTTTFLSKLNVPNEMTSKIVKLVEYHLKPFLLHKDNASAGAVKRLARKLHPATLDELIIVSKADKAGRGKPLDEVDFSFADWLLEKAKNNQVINNKPELIVTGKDLIKLGYKSGPRVGNIIKKLTQLHEDFDLSKDELLDYAHFILDKPDLVS